MKFENAAWRQMRKDGRCEFGGRMFRRSLGGALIIGATHVSRQNEEQRERWIPSRPGSNNQEYQQQHYLLNLALYNHGTHNRRACLQSLPRRLASLVVLSKRDCSVVKPTCKASVVRVEIIKKVSHSQSHIHTCNAKQCKAVYVKVKEKHVIGVAIRR